MNIAEFLEARITEDEALAEAAEISRHGERHTERWDYTSYVMSADRDCTEAQDRFIEEFWPARVLAECAAKRAVIEQAEEATGLDMSVDNDRLVGRRDMKAEPYCGDVILAALAAAYSDHPDYQQEWAL